MEAEGKPGDAAPAKAGEASDVVIESASGRDPSPQSGGKEQRQGS